MKLLILADDLTGALDTGVQFSLRNIPTSVIVSEKPGISRLTQDCEVLSINAETRHMDRKSAYYCIKSLLEKYASPGHYIYIKTDSALRGNIGAAFLAALDTVGGPLMFIPALPALLRTTRNAFCYINGTLLEESVFRRDPQNPALKSYIPEILSDSTPADRDLTCRSVTAGEVAGLEKLMKTEPADVYLFDCENEKAMEAIGEKLSSLRRYGLTAGCAGFASTFHRHIHFKRTDAAPPATKGPVLFISGSANEVTLAQLAHAKEAGFPVLSLARQIQDCCNHPGQKDVARWPVYLEARACLKKGRPLVIATAASKEELHRTDDPDFHETVALATSLLVQLLLDELPIETLSVFGGDMVAAILKRLSCHRVQAWGEICAGVPLCTFTYQGRTRSLVTKSGGFGQPDVISVINKTFQS